MNKREKILLAVGLTSLLIGIIYLLTKEMSNPLRLMDITKRNFLNFIIIASIYLSPIYLIYRILNLFDIVSGYKVFIFFCSLIIYVFGMAIFTKNIVYNHLSQGSIIVPAVINGKSGNVNSPWEIMAYYRDNYGERHNCQAPVPHGTIKEYDIGDTVLVRYAISRTDIARIFRFKPTPEEIRIYTNKYCCPVILNEEDIKIKNNIDESNN
jgi:hypothetical protein